MAWVHCPKILCEQYWLYFSRETKFLAAAVFYSIYVIGIIIFSTIPALKDGLGSTALIYGALFGFFAYLTYDMTNYSTLKDWPLQVSLIDTAWGTFLTGISSYLGYHVAKSWVTF